QAEDGIRDDLVTGVQTCALPISETLNDKFYWEIDEKRTILPERDKRIKAALKAGFNVIVDDTNLNPKHEKRLREIARHFGAEFRSEERRVGKECRSGWEAEDQRK